MFHRLKIFFLSGIFCCVIFTVAAQEPASAEELIEQYEAGKIQKMDLEALKTFAEVEPQPEKKIRYSKLLINQASEDSLFNMLHSGFLQKGNALMVKGDFVPALDSFLESLKYAQRSDNNAGVGAATIAVGDAYSLLGNRETSQIYYERGIEILRTVNDSVSLATAILNAGDEFSRSGNYDKALEYTHEAGSLFEAIDFSLGYAYYLGNLGMIDAKQGENELAKENINKAINLLQELDEPYAISEYLNYMSEIYGKQKYYSEAFEYADRSLDLSTQYGLKDQIANANLQLSELSEVTGNYANAHNYYKNHIIYRDSIKNLESVRQMADLRLDFEVSQKQLEVDLLAQQRKTQNIIIISTIIAMILIGLLAFGLYKRNKFIEKMSGIIKREKIRSENLLLNILPEETARELKNFGKVKAKRFDSVSVLFTDFCNFTYKSEHLPPEVLVESVDYYYSHFDEIMEKYGLEKIKTLGDAYMCAGGIPFPLKDNSQKILLAALEILQFVEEAKNNRSGDEVRFEIRIGVNTGPLVAGVVGSKKFAYDIWGDTVNIAARMEACSEAGRINISENTYQLVKDHFVCEYRGELEVKSKGTMKMYFVNGVKEISSETDLDENIIPEAVLKGDFS